ncbi:uncharacterized protein LOC132624848, partial [Lycium barbarum]|uniref:uncharacterized protein LOC132624848 n=1 Tax=Lycium barbarum TaxID=112863 RepID=UPI00293F1770
SALTVTNVKSLIPITLDMETGHYHEWATLFKVLACVHSVLEHIIPPTDTTELTAYNATKAANLTLWKRLDAVVLFAQLFQDNKHSRAAYLETEFTTTKMADFGSVMAYYNRLKSLADQLANVGSPVSDQRLVLRLLAGLPETYAHFVTTIQQKDVLP